MQPYEIVENTRATHLRITIHADGRVVVTKPNRISVAKAQAFAEARRGWIEETVAKFRRREERSERRVGKAIELPRLRRGTNAYKDCVKTARSIATERAQYFAKRGSFAYGTISIRNQKTRWGSCTAAGNLSFNYRIAHLPPELQDYLVVHELAHTKEHNHSARFWALVGAYIPNYLELRKTLHRYRF